MLLNNFKNVCRFARAEKLCAGARRDSVEKALQGETTRFQGYSQTAKGTDKWRDVVSPVRGASGEIVRLLSVSRDISEAKQYEFEREEMHAELFFGANFRCRRDDILAFVEKDIKPIQARKCVKVGLPSQNRLQQRVNQPAAQNLPATTGGSDNTHK